MFLIKFRYAIPFAFHSRFLYSFITLCQVFVSLVSRGAPQLSHNYLKSAIYYILLKASKEGLCFLFLSSSQFFFRGWRRKDTLKCESSRCYPLPFFNSEANSFLLFFIPTIFLIRQAHTHVLFEEEPIFKIEQDVLLIYLYVCVDGTLLFTYHPLRNIINISLIIGMKCEKNSYHTKFSAVFLIIYTQT